MLENVFIRANANHPPAVEEIYKSFIPMNRIGNPSEAAEAILWLLSDEASYVTGHK
jgi:NAD(P)-dependent dehydrogenase (short-subunit alcohol dehydrogenase family)